MSTEATRTISYGGYVINIFRDEYAECPRDAFDYSSHFYNNTRRHTFDSMRESSIEDIVENGKLSKEFLRDYIYVPVYLLDHSGEAVSTSPFGDPWDSGLFGILAESKESVKEEFGCKIVSKKRREMIEQRLRAEVNEFNQWLQGEVYGFTVTKPDDPDDVLDSCWGFYGDMDESGIIEQAKDSVDCLVSENEANSCKFWSGENAA